MSRTPFEGSDGEQFNLNEDLEMYWPRTVSISSSAGAFLIKKICSSE